MDSSSNRAPDRLTQNLAEMAVLAAIYFGAGKLGLSLAVVQPNITLVWPPTGIAVAAVLFRGSRCWPGIALGAFLVAFSIPETSLLVALGIALGNTLQALAGGWLLTHRRNFRVSLERVQDVLSLLVYAGLASTILSATFGVTSLRLG